MEKLTERQAKVLGIIWGLVRSYGKFPSYSELMGKLNLRSKQTIADFFSILERKGYVARAKNISLTEKALQYLIDEETRFLGVDFFPLFDFFPVDSKETGSTSWGGEMHVDHTHIEDSDKRDNADVRQLPSVSSGTAAAEIKAGMGLAQQRFNYEMRSVENLPNVMAGLIDNTKGEVNIVFIQNTNSVHVGGYTERKRKDLKLNFNLKAKIDRLFGLFRKV